MSYLYNSDSSADTSRERERERQRRRRQQQQQQPTMDHEPQHAGEVLSGPHNNHYDCYLENLRDDDCDYGHDNGHNNEQEIDTDVEDNRTSQRTSRRQERPKRRYNKKTILDEEWAKLLSKLKDAYFRGIGQNDIDLTALDPPATLTIFRFVTIVPMDLALFPIVLLEKHLFPTTPTDTKIAIHIDVLRCYNNVRLHARASINSIAELMKADYDCTELPATLRNTMHHTLPNYTKFKLLLDGHINRPGN
ncbi:hypothetical protein BDC45DRAFT_569187 [Circinella umbellata]|nr:hypothetical protein BDC45DRAFT_569187 [Circinella umbellata]